MRNGAFNHKSGQQAGQRSAERRAEQRAFAAADPEGYFNSILTKEFPKLARELVDAAMGRGRWSDLSPNGRQQALFRALEYAIGKPRLSEKPEKAAGEKADDFGIVLVSSDGS